MVKGTLTWLVASGIVLVILQVSDWLHAMGIWKVELLALLAWRSSFTTAEFKTRMMFLFRSSWEVCLGFVKNAFLVLLGAPHKNKGEGYVEWEWKGGREVEGVELKGGIEIEAWCVENFDWIGLAVAERMMSIVLEEVVPDIIGPTISLNTFCHSALGDEMKVRTSPPRIWMSISVLRALVKGLKPSCTVGSPKMGNRAENLSNR